MKKYFNRKDTENFNNADKYHICDKKYKEKDIRVRDRCHITAKYRGSAHKGCNRNLKIDANNMNIPIIFHNLRGYDSYFIMQNIGQIAKKHAYKTTNGNTKQLDISVIPNNMEKYMSFTLKKYLRFMDSFQFMSSSLDKLVENLSNKAIKYTKQEFNVEEFTLMKKRVLILMTSWTVLKSLIKENYLKKRISLLC